ncbi:MAG: J domain-containing protein [Anaerolineae bacterium]|nr:J domain-containing protein [Anaerolineae bacterium]
MRRKIIYDPKRDYYAILGIESDATPDEVRQAYRTRARVVHPDRNPDRTAWATEQLQMLNEAYDVLRQASQRREYDRLRWPHTSHTSARTERPSYHSPFSASDYDPNRPWWEQAVAHAPRNGEPGARAGATSAPVQEAPAWMVVAAWLRAHHFARLEPAWLTLVGLWRSPYASVLSLLAGALVLNVALIVYVLLAPQAASDLLDGVRGWFSPGVASSPASTLPTPTPDRLVTECTDPDVQILIPVNYDTVGDTLSVFGTVSDAGMWNYSIEIGYLGRILQADAVPDSWLLVRAPPLNQSVPEPPVQDDLLIEAVDLSGRAIGYYAIRLRVMLRNGSMLPPCDVIVRRS